MTFMFKLRNLLHKISLFKYYLKDNVFKKSEIHNFWGENRKFFSKDRIQKKLLGTFIGSSSGGNFFAQQPLPAYTTHNLIEYDKEVQTVLVSSYYNVCICNGIIACFISFKMTDQSMEISKVKRLRSYSKKSWAKKGSV